MIPREILEFILIFSMSATFIMLVILLYPYIKKWVYPHINNRNKYIKDKTYSVKDKTYSVKDKAKYVKDKADPIKSRLTNKNKPKLINKSKFKDLDLVDRSTENANNFSTAPDHQNKRLNKKKLNGSEYDQDLSNKKENKDMTINNSNINNEGDHDFVAKSWNEPMMENQKEIIDNFKDIDEHSNKYKNSLSNKSEPKVSFLTDDEPTLNKELSYNEDNNLKNKNLRNKNLKTIDNVDHINLKTKSTPILKEQTKPSVDSNDLSISYNNNLGKLSIGKHIIFNYNHESYLSEILEIKHNNIKILYRGSYRWIQVSDIKKILY